MRVVYVAVAAASVGICAGWYLGRLTESQAAPNQSGAETTCVVARESCASAGADPDALVRAVRAAVRSELAAVDDEVKDLQVAFEELQGACSSPAWDEASQVAANSREAAAPTPEQERRLEDMRSLVSNALSSGTWGERELTQYREVAGKVPFEEFVEEQRRLIVAINRGDVRVLTDGLPF